MRSRIETAITRQTGINTKIRGDINFGILGRTTIIAHDITIPNGTIARVSITIPFSGLFDLKNTKLNGDIGISGANIKINSLTAPKINHDVLVQDSTILYKGKDYKLINGIFHDGVFSGTMRTDQHKYDISFTGKEFTISNKNVNLVINGELYPTGGAAGTIKIKTNELNSWFEFSAPKITETVNLEMNFWWDGEYGFRFSDIVANDVRGNIILEPTGWKNINLYSDNLTFDFSFLTKPNSLFHESKLDLDFSGDLTFENKKFKHLKLDAIGTEGLLQIKSIITDNLTFTGGTIDESGAHDILMKTKINNIDSTCMFSGTPTNWKCSEFTFGDISGTVENNNGNFYADISASRDATPDEVYKYIEQFDSKTATIKFKFNNMGGKFKISPKGTTTEYDYVYGKNLKWLNPHLHILPDFMLSDVGNMVWNGDTMTFIPTSKTWSLTVHDNFFFLTGLDALRWLPKDMDTRALKNFEYSASGYYNDQGDISNLTIKIADQVFTGSANSTDITLHCDSLEIDKFLNQNFFDNYEEMEFMANAPILLPFELNKNVYLTADNLIYDGNTYRNFVYALKSGTQTFSITDKSRGNIMGTIVKERSKYDMFFQLNKFKMNGKLLNDKMPLNIANSAVTAEIHLTTNGHIANDIWHNLRGQFDLTFDGGELYGIGLDRFYADAETLTKINAEERITSALTSGITTSKRIHIVGQYANGDFVTTTPMELSLNHTMATGMLAIKDGAMITKLDFSLRGVASDPVLLSLGINASGKRSYSLQDILQKIEPAYMRSFVKTHTLY